MVYFGFFIYLCAMAPMIGEITPRTLKYSSWLLSSCKAFFKNLEALTIPSVHIYEF